MDIVATVRCLDRSDQGRRHDDVAEGAELDDQYIQGADYTVVVVRDGRRLSRYDRSEHQD